MQTLVQDPGSGQARGKALSDEGQCSSGSRAGHSNIMLIIMTGIMIVMMMGIMIIHNDFYIEYYIEYYND